MVVGQAVSGKYDRKIKYLDYTENGVRLKCAGFAKLECWDGLCSISIQVTGIYRRDHFTRPLLVLGYGEERELARLIFADGEAKFTLEKLDVRDLDGHGLDYDGLAGFRIPVSEGKEISCIWQDPGMRKAEMPEQTAEEVEAEEPERKPKKKPEKTAEEVEAEEPEKKPEVMEAERFDEARRAAEAAEAEKLDEPERKAEVIEAEKSDEARRAADAEEVGRPDEAGREAEAVEAEKPEMPKWEAEAAEIEKPDEFEEPERSPDIPPALMYEEKWEQLSSVYPHIFPFHDEREYLSMGPADFVILPGRYYKLVSNSFLLHGYYNYDHLILARMEKRGNYVYYVGVPGNYYEREKRVAVLFGFQSFESDREPAEEGDFGYYMIPVEL